MGYYFFFPPLALFTTLGGKTSSFTFSNFSLVQFWIGFGGCEMKGKKWDYNVGQLGSYLQMSGTTEQRDTQPIAWRGPKR